MSAGSSRARPEFYVPNGNPKCLWLQEQRPGARKLAARSPLLPEHEAAIVDITSGKMPLSQPQRRNLMEVLRKAPDPRGSNTRFRTGPVLCIVAMALLCGALQMAVSVMDQKEDTKVLKEEPSMEVEKDYTRQIGFNKLVVAWHHQMPYLSEGDACRVSIDAPLADTIYELSRAQGLRTPARTEECEFHLLGMF